MKLRFSLTLAVGALLLNSHALWSSDQLAHAAARILQAAESNARVLQTLQHLTDRIGPRLSGSPQAEAAVRWTAEQMRLTGLANVRLQPVTVPRWVRGAETAELLSPSRQRLPVTALGGSVGTPPEGITAEVIEVSSFEALKDLGDRVQGKIVYYHTPLNPTVHPMDAYGFAIRFRSRGAVEAARYGAAASLIRSLGTGSLGTPHTGAMYYAEGVPRIPHAALAPEAGDLLHRLIAAGERPSMKLLLTCRPEAEVESANVLGELPGRENPEEIVLIASHLDSWDLGSGAIDAAFACAIAMEVPRLLRELNLVPRRTIRVGLFMAEEVGNLGAKRYADMSDAELAAHFAAVEGDAGPDRPFGFRLSRGSAIGGTRAAALPDGDPGLTRAFAALQAWTRYLEPTGASWVDYGGLEGSGPDVVPLGQKGVLSISMRNDQSRYLDIHHTDGDTFDKIDPQNLRRNLAAIAFLAYALAETNENFSGPRAETSER